MKKRSNLVYGVGTNDADYNVYQCKNGKTVWVCPFYVTWVNMLKRCYSHKYQSRNPTYIGCSVCDGWLTFSNFKSWMGGQYWEGKQLDKDILKPGNKIYGPDTCVFIDQIINTFTTDSGASREDCLLGVYFHKQRGKFRSYCRNPFTKKLEHLGYFTNQQEAHQAWRKRKHELACQLAGFQSDERVAESLKTRYNQPNINSGGILQ